MTRERFTMELGLKWADLPAGELSRESLRFMQRSFNDAYVDALSEAPCAHNSLQNYLNTVTRMEHCGICQKPLREVPDA